jgi:phospholipid transport system transporter-binding protein
VKSGPGATFQLDAQSEETLALGGVLSFETAAAVLVAIRQALARGRQVQLDLAGVSRSDSAGLSCVLAAVADAGRHGRSLRVTGMPAGMLALARVCGVENLMP